MNREVVAAVHLAQHFAWKKMGLQVVAEFYPEVYEFLGISAEDFEKSVMANNWLNVDLPISAF
jgi:hypothetical protein